MCSQFLLVLIQRQILHCMEQQKMQALSRFQTLQLKILKKKSLMHTIQHRPLNSNLFLSLAQYCEIKYPSNLFLSRNLLVRNCPIFLSNPAHRPCNLIHKDGYPSSSIHNVSHRSSFKPFFLKLFILYYYISICLPIILYLCLFYITLFVILAANLLLKQENKFCIVSV